MLAQNNEYIAEAASTIYELTEEEKIRLQCQAREDFIRTQKDREYLQAQREALISEQAAQINSLIAENKMLRSKLNNEQVHE